MKKLPLALIAMLTLSISAYFVSCKKEAEPAMLLPAIQKIRDVPAKDWEVVDNSLAQIPIVFEQKLKKEFENYETDSTIAVTVRVKFKDQAGERLLPYSIPGLGGTRYYFYTLQGGKPKLFFHITGDCDLSAGQAASALPVETITIVYEKMDIK
jgi:hypothetical protein